MIRGSDEQLEPNAVKELLATAAVQAASGRSTARRLLLARQTVAALAACPRIAERDHLFGGTSRKGFTKWSHAKAQFDAVLRFNRPWGLHDCRRTVETRLAGLGVNKTVANRILNHAIEPVTQSYDFHDYLPEKVAALQLWADELECIVQVFDRFPTVSQN